jgi:glycosyltransferase involved in cell wall biosynthesis
MISVCIATYNGEKYIAEQLNSILCQLDEKDEVIISDDSSTDQTLEIIKGFNDHRIKIFAGNKFANPIYNFENAIKMASGEFIFLSDQDDYWMPTKVEEMIKVLQTNLLVVSDCYMGDQDLNIIKESYFEWRDSKQGLIKNIWRNSYLGCCMAFDRKILKRILPFPKNIPMHDMWIGLITETIKKPFFLQKPLIIYRRHGGNATTLTNEFKSTASAVQKLKYRWNIIAPLLLRTLRFK